MSKAESLYRLQLLDNDLDTLRKRVKEIDTAITANPAVLHANAELAAAEKATVTLSATLKDLELESQTLDEKIRTEEQRLYDGTIKAPKEMVDAQNEVESLKRRRAALDEPLLSAMEAAEEARQTEAACKAGVADAKRKWKDDSVHLLAERETLVARANALSEQRKASVAKLLRPDLDAYVALRVKKPNGVAVALIKNSSCSQCGEACSSMQLQQARVGVNLTHCSNCGRVLYGA